MSATPGAQQMANAAFLASIIEHVAHPIFVKDRGYRFVLVNRAFTEMTGRSREELLGRRDHDFFPLDEADYFRNIDVAVFASGQVIRVEQERLTDASGQLHLLATTKVPLRSAQQQVTHLVGIVHDVTLLKRTEEALRLANEELDRRVADRTAELAAAQAELMRKERLAVLGQLTGGLAHQIRNPLGAIVNATSLLQRALGPIPSPEVQSAIGMLREEAWRANRIITDLIDYARVRPPARSQVPVKGLLEQALGMQEQVPGISVHWELCEEPLFVSIDAEQVLGALNNLIRNAVEAMPSGGELTLGAAPEQGQVRLTIRDTGPGLEREVRQRLFQPLVTSKPFGLGLGLPTARALVENQGGRVTCARTDATGTTFELLLPS